MNALLRYLMRTGWQRGVRGGERAWVIVGGAALLAHLARKAAKRETDVVFSEKLGPGESVRITHESGS